MERPAFDHLLIVALPKVRAYCKSLVRGSADLDAMDLVQDVAASALQHADKFQAGTDLIAWLATIAVYRHLSERRRKWRSVNEAVDDEFFNSIPAPERDPAIRVELAQTIDLVQRVATPHAGSILIDYALSECNSADLKAKYAISGQGIRSEVYRAREALRKALVQ